MNGKAKGKGKRAASRPSGGWFFFGWFKEWAFWVAVASVVGSLGGWSILEGMGVARQDVIGPRPLAVNGIVGEVNGLPESLVNLVRSNKCTNLSRLKTRICTILDQQDLSCISIGSWLICPDSGSNIDSLFVRIWSKSATILGAVVANSGRNDDSIVLGVDSSSITFNIRNLVAGEKWGVFLLVRGTTEVPFAVEFPKGTGRNAVITAAQPLPQLKIWIHAGVWLFVGVGLLSLVGLTIKKIRLRLQSFGSLRAKIEGSATALVNEFAPRQENE